MSIDITVNPNPYMAMAVMEASGLNNEALALSKQGDMEGAERLHLEAIRLKENGLGRNHITTALSYNALGELYIEMNRLRDAEDYLLRASRIRNSAGADFDAAVTRDNLGRLYEMKGDLLKARASRMSGGPNSICCGNYTCPAMSSFTLSTLSHCSKCKSVFYCSKNCQKSDWKRHKKFCQNVEDID